MGPLGIPETIFIFVLALLISAEEVPELGKTLGKAMGEFKRASSELKETFEREMQTIERETESLKIDTHKYTNEIYNYDCITIPAPMARSPMIPPHMSILQ